MRNSKVLIYNIGIFLCIISLFVFPRLLRMVYLGELSSFNLLFYIGLIMFLKKNRNQINIKRNNNQIIISIIIVAILSFLTFISHDYSNTSEKIGYIIINCLPIFIISDLLNYDNDKFDKFADKWYKTLKIICTVLVFSWIVDQFTGNIIQRFIVNLYKLPSLSGSLYENRFVSIYGHPLFNAVLMFSLLLWTFVIKSKRKEKCYIITIIISIVGIAITGSKSILVLAILLIIINFMSKDNIKYIIPFMIIVFVLYNLGIFDVPLSRLSSGLSSGNISTGRNTWIVSLRESGILRFSFIHGHPLDTSITGLVAALEYPILRWAYKTGIIFSTILTSYYFVLPLSKMIVKHMHNVRFILSIILYMLAVNVNDSITSNCDALIIYIMNICLLYYVARNKNVESD